MIATPLPEVERPETKNGLKQIADLVEQRGAEQVVVGLPLTLAGEEGEQAARACLPRRSGKLGTGGAARRATHHQARRADRGRGRRRLAGRRAPPRELAGERGAAAE